MSATTKQITRAIKIVAPKDSTLPVIESVYFTGNTIVATDLEVRLYIPFKVPEPFLADAIQVCDVFDAFGVNFIPSVDAGRKIHFKSGSRSIKMTEQFPAEEFPSLNTEETFTQLGKLSEQDVDNILIASDFTFPESDFRPVMQRVAITGGQIVATDSHRLFWVDTTSGIDGVFIRKKTWKLLNEFVGPWIVDQNPYWDRFANEDGVIIIQKRETERYPNYKAVIPKDNPIQLTMTKKELSEALKQGEKFAGESKIVALCIDGGITLKFQDVDMEREFSTELKLVSITNCEPFNIGFNIPYLKGVLKHCPETVIFQVGEPMRPALIGDNLLLMPVDISNREFN